MSVAVGNSGLRCCVHMTSFERQLTPLCVCVCVRACVRVYLFLRIVMILGFGFPLKGRVLAAQRNVITAVQLKFHSRHRGIGLHTSIGLSVVVQSRVERPCCAIECIWLLKDFNPVKM